MPKNQIKSRTAGKQSDILNKVMEIYVRERFSIHIIMTDMEFEKVAELLRRVEVNIAAV